MIKISFDYDSTLSRKSVQEYAKSLIDKGFDIWIVTSRFDTETAISKNWYWVEASNNKLFEVARYVGIKYENIIFTNSKDKILFLKDKNFTLHIDDDVDELMNILTSGDSCKTINVEHSDWIENCNDFIKEKLLNK